MADIIMTMTMNVTKNKIHAPRTDALLQTKAEQFCKLRIFGAKIDPNTNFAKLPNTKWLLL